MTTTWPAQFIAPDTPPPGAPLLTRTFDLPTTHGSVQRATLAASALGVFEARLNGIRVGQDLLAPGWTSYEWRIPVVTYDVSDLLAAPAGNSTVLQILLGNGWHRGKLGWENIAENYGSELAAFACLEMTFADGHTSVIATDQSWQATVSDVVSDDLYDGQSIDARRRAPAGVGGPGSAVHIVDVEPSRLAEILAPPVRAFRELAPVRCDRSPSGSLLLDFGQNITGWIRITVQGRPGQEIVVRHAEVLEDGDLAVRPLRGAKATDRYILSGELDTFEPRFTFHGFRYARIQGWDGPVPEGAITAVVIGSELIRTGDFHCSDDLLNRLHENALWSTRGNFVSIPTDCPQRDERLGWTGDIAVFAPTASYLFDTRDFLSSWLTDLALEQHHQGVVPFVVPDPLKYAPAPMGFTKPPITAIWSDAAVWVPWALWQAYDDTTVVRRQLESMVTHARSVAGLLSERHLWEGDGFQFGDWLDPAAPPDRPGDARADRNVAATACAFRTMTMLAQMTAAISRDDLSIEFGSLARLIKDAFARHYVQPGGVILSDAPTAYALAIRFGLLDDEHQALAGHRLAALVVSADYAVSTGFAGTPFILDALTDTGHVEVAYGLLQRRECPSWLYPITMGATTIWERWDSMLPDGSINPGEMTSFNHYTFGSVADWMRRVIGGLSAISPGYRRVRFAPRPGGGITSASTYFDADAGRISITWQRSPVEGATGDLRPRITIEVDVPDGISAVVANPFADERVEVGSGRHTITF